MTLRDLLSVADTKQLVLVDEKQPGLSFQVSAAEDKMDYHVVSIYVQDNQLFVIIKDKKQSDLNDLNYSFDVGV